jgi:uncharacterized protein
MRLPAKFLWSATIAALVAIGASGCASIDRWQREAIFQTEVAARVEGREAPAAAEQFDLPLPGGGVTGADRVRFWYLPATAADAPTVLYLHGARRNLYDNTRRIERLNDLGFAVLALDYRGFGRSTRILPSEQSAIEDAHLALAELARRQPDAGRRLLYGYSLGGAVAIALAQQHDAFAGVVVEATFTSIPEVVQSRRWVPLVGLVVTQRFDSVARIAHVNEPLLFVHGTSDRVVPHTMSDQLFEAARAVPPQFKRVVKVEGAPHWGSMVLESDVVGRALREFVELTRGVGPWVTSVSSATPEPTAGAAASLR